MIKTFVTVATAVLVATTANAGNLVTNGSFESGLAGWTLVGTETQGFPPVAITYGAAARIRPARSARLLLPTMRCR